MDSIVFECVSKGFRHRPALFNRFGNERSGQTMALNSVSLRVSPARVLALLGPNGSGKTTLLKLISTMLLPDSGRVLVEGFDTRLDPQCVRPRVGFAVATERSFFPRLTALENLEFFAALENLPRAGRKAWLEYVLALVGLFESRDTLTMKLSSGMYQRLGIARALTKRPSILLLDEPTRSLDAESAARVCEVVCDLAQNGTTIVLATHNFDEAAAVADSLLVLRNGEASMPKAIGRPSAQDIRDFYRETLNASKAAMLESA